MGRSSVEATKASFIRASRAACAALAARLRRLEGFLALAPGLAGFFVFFLFFEAGLCACAPVPPEVCPATGTTTIRIESKAAKKQEMSLKAGFGEVATLMSLL
jgi:hypothetical protein